MVKKLLGKLREVFQKLVHRKKDNSVFDVESGMFKVNGKQEAFHKMVFLLETGYNLHVTVIVKSKDGKQFPKHVEDYVANWAQKGQTCHMKNQELSILSCIAEEFQRDDAKNLAFTNIEVENIEMTLIFSFRSVISQPRILTYDIYEGIKPISCIRGYQKNRFEMSIEPHVKELICLYREACASLRPI